jgi:hypothetical protein
MAFLQQGIAGCFVIYLKIQGRFLLEKWDFEKEMQYYFQSTPNRLLLYPKLRHFYNEWLTVVENHGFIPQGCHRFGLGK